MRALLISPEERAVYEIELTGEDPGREVREVLDTEQLVVQRLSELDHLVIDAEAVDRVGEEPVPVWRIDRGPGRPPGPWITGAALVLGNVPGGQGVAEVNINAGQLRSALVWAEGTFSHIESVPLGPTMTPRGIGSAFAQVPVFRVEEPAPEPLEAPTAEAIVEAAVGRREPPAAKPVQVWSVTKPGPLYRAQLLELTDGKQRVLVELENEDLVELRGQLPRGLRFVPRTSRDHDAIVESWVQP